MTGYMKGNTPPMTTASQASPAGARREVRRVLLVTLAANLSVALGKIVVGLVTGALSITADGFHSLVDGSSNLVGLIANSIAGKPADEDHPYGHRRFETIAALGIGILLLITAWEIIGGALERLQGGEPPQVTPTMFAVLLVTLVVNIAVNRYEKREGERLNSELLLADAAHTGSDIYVTLSVMISMALVALGIPWADPIAALAIVALIARAAWDILKRTGGILVDTAPLDAGQLEAVVADVPSVERVTRVRSRGSADAAHVDVDVQVAPEMTADHAAAIADAIRRRVQDAFKGVTEVEVHFEPQRDAEPDYALAARARADALGLATHEVRVTEGDTGKVLEMHVEVAPDQTLEEAHARVTELEQAVTADLPEVAEIVTHIEPALHNGQHETSVNDEDDQLAEQALKLLNENFPEAGWHHLRATRLNGGYALTLHVSLPAEMTVEQAHTLAENAELRLRSEIPRLYRVTIHTEPER